MNRWRASAIAPLIVGALAMAESPLTAPRSAAEAAQGEVAIRLFAYSPSTLTVSKGATVTWTNGDDITHTVTAGAPGQEEARFEGRLDGKGAAYRHTFAEPGRYPYYCDRHQAMVGEILVK
jgi:plastocyanin